MQTASTREASWRAPPRRIWFALAAPPSAWALQLAFGTITATLACRNVSPDTVPMTSAGIRALELTYHAILLGVTLWALRIGWSEFRRSHEPGLIGMHAETRPDYLAVLSLFMGVVFTFGVINGTLPAFFLSMCERVR